MTKNVTLTINMDASCAECRKPGATGSGLCLKCATRAMRVNDPMKSAEGRALQARLKDNLMRAVRG